MLHHSVPPHFHLQIVSGSLCAYLVFIIHVFFQDLKSNMTVDTDDAIHAVHRSLQGSHECTVHELGKNFYRNYAEYVKVAQEADKFENDLSMMRAMISQLKGFSNDITGVRDNYGIPSYCKGLSFTYNIFRQCGDCGKQSFSCPFYTTTDK